MIALIGAMMLVLASGVCNGQQPSPKSWSRSAEFRVTTDVVHENVLPFTATIGGIGNSLINEGGGFEPVIYRNKYLAKEDSPSRVVVEPEALSNYDSLREGFLDQAVAHVYRIENGKFRMIREDRIPVGGFHVSGWHRAINGNVVIAPDSSRFVYRWDGWNRPRAKYYFTVRAIDKSGNLSPPATEFEIDRPDNVGKGGVVNSLIEFKPSKLSLLLNMPSSVLSPVPAPKNLKGMLRMDGSLSLQWDPVDAQNLAGYVVYQSDYPSSMHKGFYFELAKHPASPSQHIKTGDLVIVSKKIYSPSRNQSLSNRVWGAESEYNKILPGLVKFFPDEDSRRAWQFVPHGQNTPVEESGETYLKLELAAGVTQSIETYNHSGTGQDWYDVLETKTHRVEVWLRQEGAGTVRFRLGGFYGNVPQKVEPIKFHVGHKWEKYVATFTPPVIQTGSQPGNMSLEFTGPGVFYVDNFRVYLTGTDYLDLLPKEYEAIKSAELLALRTHGLISTKNRSYDMEQLTNSGGAISGSREKPNTLPQLLKVMRKAGVQPWLQIESHLSPQEWLAFVEYLAAPYDPIRDTPRSKPWAYKRYTQGQLRPWADEFDTIYLELSNETWNRLFYPWTFENMTDASTGKNYTAGQVYGLFQEHVISLLRSSPYWRQAGLDKKFKFVIGGWGNLPYGADAASTSPSSDLMTIAAYNGGWDEGEGPPERNATSLFDVLSHTSQSVPVADRHIKEVNNLRERGHGKLRMGTYEAGPGYALNGLNNTRVTAAQDRAQEQVMKSMAAGTATLDAFLARAYRGFEIQNFFSFGRGDHWKSHAKWYQGGQAYPSWKLLALFNNEATGDMLRTETHSVPTAELSAFNRRQAIKDAPLVSVYASRKANRLSLFVLSRKVPGLPAGTDAGFTPVTVELPFNRADSITLYRMTGDPLANNLTEDNVKIEKVEIPSSQFSKRFTLNAMNGAEERGLPPASSYLYVFKGVDFPARTPKASPKKRLLQSH